MRVCAGPSEGACHRTEQSDGGEVYPVKRIETDVLIVGAGPAGAMAALALSRSGVRCIVVSKYRWSANGPRAHLINQRTMEVYRDLKVEDKILEQATPNELLGHNIFLESLTGIEYGRLYSWGNDPAHRGEYINASPTIHVDLPQDRLEPILITEAARLGAHVRFSTELTDLVQRDDSVTASVCERLTDEKFEIRSAYMIGADGANSRVAEIIGLPMVGETNLGVVVSALFRADLARFYVNWPGASVLVLPARRRGLERRCNVPYCQTMARMADALGLPPGSRHAGSFASGIEATQ
jgi:2,4-dichlorophenol 6-monooxygenase